MIKLTRDEIMETRNEQDIMWLLRTQGAPVIGTAFLKLDPEYVFTISDDHCTGDRTVTWRKRDEC